MLADSFVSGLKNVSFYSGSPCGPVSDFDDKASSTVRQVLELECYEKVVCNLYIINTNNSNKNYAQLLTQKSCYISTFHPNLLVNGRDLIGEWLQKELPDVTGTLLALLLLCCLVSLDVG